MTWAGLIRARNGDLPGALAALQEAMAHQHADGNRLALGITLRIVAVVLARLGEAEPAAVLSGAFSAHFPPSISAVHRGERMEIREAQSLARRALGEAANGAALARGTAMDDDEVVGYAQGEVRRVAALLAGSGEQAPELPPARRDRAGNDRVMGKATCSSRAGAVGHHDHSSRPPGGDRPPASLMPPW